MVVDIDQIDSWLTTEEDEHIEFKEAKNQYSFEEPVLLRRTREVHGSIRKRGRGLSGPGDHTEAT